jgi:transcriptional regulator with XRE-family HTH domain
MLLGLSQEQLGETIGLTFQQVQKYERGANRIGASRLWELSGALDVPVQYFFAEMAEETIRAMRRITMPGKADELPDLSPAEGDDDDAIQADGALARRETLELVRAYYRISDPAVRKRLFELAKALAFGLGAAEEEH